MKTIPQIQKYMTTVPQTIAAHMSVHDAYEMMIEQGIRHLPVLEDAKIVGIITDRDIRMLQGFEGVDLKKEKVGSACSLEPYIVEPSASLDDVCLEMAQQKYGSVLVQDNNKLVGIFTWIDALLAMHELMVTRLKKS